MKFVRATKSQARLRLAITGGPGDGKTYSALSIAAHLAPGGRIAVVDTENASASKYAGDFAFDVLVLSTFSPQLYVDAIHAAESEGYDVIIIDSLSHAWMGAGGALELKDRAANRSGNSWTAWRDVTPLQNALVGAIVQSRAHVIATLRTKIEYQQSEGGGGKKTIQRLGSAPVQREGMEYEFDVVGAMDSTHTMEIVKTRATSIPNGSLFKKPGKDLAVALRSWLTDGTPIAPPSHVTSTLEKQSEALGNDWPSVIATAVADRKPGSALLAFVSRIATLDVAELATVLPLYEAALVPIVKACPESHIGAFRDQCIAKIPSEIWKRMPALEDVFYERGAPIAPERRPGEEG